MISQLLFFLLFGNVVESLRCKVSSPPNCEYNSTCSYSIQECNRLGSESIRGGVYCMSLIENLDRILVGKMDCMYDQETSKPCKNQSECQMKYTNKDNKFLHCCCDEDYCNLNFTVSNPFQIDTTPIQKDDGQMKCENLFCKSIYLLSVPIIILFLLIIILFLYRKRIVKSLNKIKLSLGLSPSKNSGRRSPIEDDVENPHVIGEDVILLPEPNKEINIKDLIIETDSFRQGRFSKIYRGKLKDEEVAVKILSKTNSNDETASLFDNEKKIYLLPCMEHQNILKFYGYSMTNSYYLIFEYAETGSLRDYLRRNLIIDENTLINYCKQISEGLEYLHTDFRRKACPESLTRSPIAHRDVKSDNIIIKEQRLIICDFAMSILLDENTISANDQQQIGTPRYMAPEILAGTIGNESNALLKSDVYALALIFWEILSRCELCNPDEIYSMAFEKELISKGYNRNGNINDMLQIINSNKPSNRPIIDSSWKTLNNKSINEIIRTIEESWQQDPEGRISAALIALRMRTL